MAGRVDQMKGKTKEAVGDLAGNNDLKSEGRADRQAGDAKEKVGKGYSFFGTCVELGEGIDVGIGITEASVIGINSIVRIEVADRGEDGLVLIADLIAIPTVKEGVVDLGVVDVGILKLRITILAAELRVAVDALIIQAADDQRIRW